MTNLRTAVDRYLNGSKNSTGLIQLEKAFKAATGPRGGTSKSMSHDELKQKLADARDIAMPRLELESLCAAALNRIGYLEWKVEDSGGEIDD